MWAFGGAGWLYDVSINQIGMLPPQTIWSYVESLKLSLFDFIFFCPPGSWCWWHERRNRYCKKCFSNVAGILTVLTLGIKHPWVVWSMRRDWKPKGTCWLCAENRLTVIDKILVKWNAHRSHVWKKGSRLTIWCKGQQQHSRSGKAEVCWWWFYAAAWRSRQKRLSGLSF